LTFFRTGEELQHPIIAHIARISRTQRLSEVATRVEENAYRGAESSPYIGGRQTASSAHRRRLRRSGDKIYDYVFNQSGVIRSRSLTLHSGVRPRVPVLPTPKG